MKSSENQRVPFMLDKTRKPLLPQLETKNRFFGKMSLSGKNVKRGEFIDIDSVAKYQKM